MIKRRTAAVFSWRSFLRIPAVLLIAAVLLFASAGSRNAGAEGLPETARPSVNGRLHVEGTQLTDASGHAVQLRGVSTHGLTWYPEFISESLFRQVSDDWNCNLVRLAMYSALYCGGEKEENLQLLRKGIDAAIAADQYVLVDWHILEDADPNINLEEALSFFDLITAEYADSPNLLFEICNEPNGSTDWSDVLTYSEQVIPVIRKHIPDAVIVVGTPEYDRNLAAGVLRPLPFDNGMYVLHFYAATHDEGLRGELEAALSAGLPVFISECGICEANGDGRIDFASAAAWFQLLNEHKISYAVWSLSDKDESSAFFKPGFNPENQIQDGDLTVSGLWVRDLIRGMDPAEIAAPAAQLEKDTMAVIQSMLSASLGSRGTETAGFWPLFAAGAAVFLVLLILSFKLLRRIRGKQITYDDIVGTGITGQYGKSGAAARLILMLSAWCTLIYLCWRVVCSVPVDSGFLAVAGNLLLFVVEFLGFIESAVLYRNLRGMRDHPLPEIPEDAWPDVDIFIATYNEPVELLRKTINGCVHLKYPDRNKVHIWLCDDNRRPEMRALAEEMGVGYFDRPDNEGAKAGNLNHALGLTSAPYVVTFDADMIPRSEFLLKTIPYFVDVELRESRKPEAERKHLGLLQSPQAFYDPDVFQYALYSEKRAPNEQDFFYRTIEPAKTATNSVIYGGSNTVLSRKALEDIGGFFTGSITEDFATGMLIEAAGYISLAIPEPLASGQTPHTFREHIQQRTRWARGVIVTARKLKSSCGKKLSFSQKMSYWSSVVYWYSPLKNLIYVLSPLLYAAFAIPVFRCNWLDLLIFWLPMFLLQDLSLRLNSKNAISTKWSGIYETSVMMHLLIPVIKETLGITLSAFKVTDKSGSGRERVRDTRSMIPFLILIGLSVAGIIRILVTINLMQIVSMLVLLFWIVRNLYFLVMAVFLVDGRDGDSETVRVMDADPVTVQFDGTSYQGVTTALTEHNLTVFLDDDPGLKPGMSVGISVGEEHPVGVAGVVTGIRESRRGTARTYTVEILDYRENEMEYIQLLYDRIPTLPQSLHRDFGMFSHLWQNIACRVARTKE